MQRGQPRWRGHDQGPLLTQLSWYAVIIATFTFGTWINRRRNVPRPSRRYDVEHVPQIHVTDEGNHSDTASTASESESLTSTSSAESSPPLKPVGGRSRYMERDSRRLGRPNIVFDLLSRFFNKFPFLVEIWYWNLTYW